MGTCIWGEGRTGLILGAVMLACYLITAFVSLVVLIVVTSGFDLLWYLHPIIIVIACIHECKQSFRAILVECPKYDRRPQKSVQINVDIEEKTPLF